jgi:hypothetical protein
VPAGTDEWRGPDYRWLVGQEDIRERGAMSTGTIAIQPGRERRRWMVRLVISFVAVTVAALAFVGVVNVTSQEPIAETSQVLPIFAGGPIHPGGWEEKPPGYGGASQESPVSEPASGYGRTFGETGHQRG